jgi:hypothetical protein
MLSLERQRVWLSSVTKKNTTIQVSEDAKQPLDFLKVPNDQYIVRRSTTITIPVAVKQEHKSAKQGL